MILVSAAGGESL